MAADVAHDFGNLMTVLLGYSELLVTAAACGEPPDQAQLAELRRAAHAGDALTTSLLNYCRPSADDAAPLDLARFVAGLAPLLDRLVGSAGQLTVTAEPTTATILADARHLEQLIINLILNARDALAVNGRVEIAIEPIRLTAPLEHILGTAAPGEYVRLRVRDNGRGMCPETVAQLFRPFFTTKDTGAGLGLTIVARIAAEANAAIGVDSAVGTGTTVDVYFPRLDASADN